MQRKVYKNSLSLPDEVKEIMDEKIFDKSRIYQLDKSSYSFARDLYKQLEFLVRALPSVTLTKSLVVIHSYSGTSE